MKKIIALFLLATVFLGGCSGREDSATAEGVSGTSDSDSLSIGAAQQVGVGNIRLLSASPSLNTGIGDVTIITAIVTDSSNRALADFVVDFSADGGVLQNVQETTNEAGEATAELSLAGDFRNRNITVCLLYTSPSPRDRQKSRMPSSA